MAQKKLIRFAAIKNFANVLEYPSGMQGRWASFFKNDHPLVLELACGKGEYAVGLGKLSPEKNFIGLDVKGNRMYSGAKYANENNMGNIAFLRTEIDKIGNYFAPGEVSEIWITFPDPQLRLSKAKKRLTHPRFLRLYQQILQVGGKINLKTDSPVLYEFTKRVIGLFGLHLIEDYNDVHQQASAPELLQIRTHYEGLNISGSNRIHYLQFVLPEGLLPDLDEQLKQLTIEYELNGGD
ncbi:MAG: tRNA (guanosine(46)-N7)-methyltransferase TrmB [Chitinophagaceae bacterium]